VCVLTGWLILPLEQDVPTDPSAPLQAWFSHHVPEFWTNSPHDFQIIVRGDIAPTACVHNDIYPLNLPVPSVSTNTNELLVYEYSFTPPSPFSLNDLLSGSIRKLNGVYFNGSFDTPYERIPQSLATLTVHSPLTTATYINETADNAFKNLRYLSYPRGGLSSNHLYLAHEIRVQPDFDHIVHATVNSCSTSSSFIDNEYIQKAIHTPGMYEILTSYTHDII
jgi:hypothetical protein